MWIRRCQATGVAPQEGAHGDTLCAKPWVRPIPFYNLMHMSLITRCTACGTLFKVVPDQLKMGDGWVRCGHCAEVFDAAAHLQEPTAAPELPVHPFVPDAVQQPFSVPPSPPPLAPEVSVAQWTPVDTPLAAVDVPLDAGVTEDHGNLEDLATSAVQQPWEDTSAQEVLLPDPPALSVDMDLNPLPTPVSENDDETPSSLLLHTATHDDVLDADASAVAIDDVAVPPDVTEDAGTASAGASDFSFVRQAERKAFWRRPLVRWLLLLLCVGLLGVLGFQAVVQHRDEIAARVPALRPLLEQACQRLGCEVSARRHIESVVIDSSSFNKTRGDTYQLSLTLKNTAATVVAAPSIELTLTDAQDQPILRRVLRPADLGVAPELPAKGDANVSLPIGVAGEAGSARIAGYRLLAFYP